MDEDGIGLVLARASELRSKITNSIHNASSTVTGDTTNQQSEEEEDESLLNIRDALESLEAQLSSLQALQQQQWYEKESSLAKIDHSRKKLLQKLKDYKGDDGLEVIHEATAFASSTVDIESNDLLLPPYPTRPCESSFPFKHIIPQNGPTASHSTNENKPRIDQSEPRYAIKGWKQVVGAAIKAAFALVGVVALLGLSGFEPRVGKRGSELRFLGVSQEVCPPGKVLVVENGETRCLVKERVEIPFESFAMTPDVNYGCGFCQA